jgi:hypothetical protein
MYSMGDRGQPSKSDCLQLRNDRNGLTPDISHAFGRIRALKFQTEHRRHNRL